MKRRITAILAILAAASVLTACGGSDPVDDVGFGTTAPTETDTQTAADPTMGDMLAQQIGDVDFGGTEFRIVSPPPVSIFTIKRVLTKMSCITNPSPAIFCRTAFTAATARQRSF